MCILTFAATMVAFALSFAAILAVLKPWKSIHDE